MIYFARFLVGAGVVSAFLLLSLEVGLRVLDATGTPRDDPDAPVLLPVLGALTVGVIGCAIALFYAIGSAVLP